MGVFFWSTRNTWVCKWKENGKDVRRTFKTKQEALAFEAEHQSSLMDKEPEALTFGELTALYFRSNPDKHRDTKRKIVYFLAGHEKEGKHIEGVGEFLRNKYAEALSRQDLERMREGFRMRKTGNNTINKFQAYIHAILAWGVDQELIHINPWRDYKRLKIKRTPVQVSINDLRQLYPYLPEYLQWAVKTAFFLALRPGEVELFGLLWTAFDWRRGIVHVQQGKSGKIKTVVLHPSYLEEAYTRYIRDIKNGISLVCHREGNKILSYRTAWLLACKRAGVKMRPYDIRHIAATEMLAGGADLAAVAAQLGHSNVATTGSTYAHVTPGSQAKAAILMPGIETSKKNGNDD